MLNKKDTMVAISCARFCILMDNGDNSLKKSPEYIVEKLKVSLDWPDITTIMNGLDIFHQIAFYQWLQKWKEHLDPEVFASVINSDCWIIADADNINVGNI